MSNELRVGVVDSGHRVDQAASVRASRGFVHGEGLDVHARDATPDRLGHGSAVLDRIAFAAPQAAFCVAQVFHERAAASPLQIAEAIHWLIEQDVRVINLSLGLRADRAALRDACARAVSLGIVICSSSPAQGEPVFPACYAGVVRVTGDARCNAHQWSWLDSAQADFGAVVTSATRSALAGASIATAALSGIVAAWLMQHPDAGRDDVLAHLREQAAFVGVERRTLAS
jgi:hypothetical protein